MKKFICLFLASLLFIRPPAITAAPVPLALLAPAAVGGFVAVAGGAQYMAPAAWDASQRAASNLGQMSRELTRTRDIIVGTGPTAAHYTFGEMVSAYNPDYSVGDVWDWVKDNAAAVPNLFNTFDENTVFADEQHPIMESEPPEGSVVEAVYYNQGAQTACWGGYATRELYSFESSNLQITDTSQFNVYNESCNTSVLDQGRIGKFVINSTSGYASIRYNSEYKSGYNSDGNPRVIQVYSLFNAIHTSEPVDWEAGIIAPEDLTDWLAMQEAINASDQAVSDEIDKIIGERPDLWGFAGGATPEQALANPGDYVAPKDHPAELAPLVTATTMAWPSDIDVPPPGSVITADTFDGTQIGAPTIQVPITTVNPNTGAAPIHHVGDYAETVSTPIEGSTPVEGAEPITEPITEAPPAPLDAPAFPAPSPFNSVDFSPITTIYDGLEQKFPFNMVASAAAVFDQILAEPKAPVLTGPGIGDDVYEIDFGFLDGIMTMWRASLAFFFHGFIIYAIIRFWR